MTFQNFEMTHYDRAIALWKATPGIGQTASDLPEKLEHFLKRNPGFSFMALDGERFAGTILCGHDGRRGYIYHLCVGENYRKRGLGRQLVDLAVKQLKEAGIEKCHAMVFENNEEGKKFWNSIGFHKRNDLEVMTIELH